MTNVSITVSKQIEEVVKLPPGSPRNVADPIDDLKNSCQRTSINDYGDEVSTDSNLIEQESRSVATVESNDSSGVRYSNSSSSLDSCSYDEEEVSEYFAIISIEEGLATMKQKLGKHHPVVTSCLRSLALEYKVLQKYEKSITIFREAICLLKERIALEDSNERRDDSSNNLLSETKVDLLGELSILYGCLGSVYKVAGLFKESMDFYVQSINILIEAGHDSESPRVSLMMRNLKRSEALSKSKI